MEEKHAIEVTDLVISYQNLKNFYQKICCISTARRLIVLLQ